MCVWVWVNIMQLCVCMSVGDMGFIVSVYAFINCNESFKLALCDSNFMLDTLM